MTFESDISLRKRLTPLHQIGACLIAGVIVFAGVALTIGPIATSLTSSPAGAAGGSMSMPALMRVIWGVLACTQIPLALFLRVPAVNRAAALRGRGGADGGDVHQPTFDAFRTLCIVRLALLEGVALLAAIAVMFSGDAIDLLLVGAPVVLMIAVFPTTGRWFEFDRDVQARAALGR